MAILFNQNIKNLIIGRGLLGNMAGATGYGNLVATVSVTIFSGTQPAAADIAANWTNYNTSYLSHWVGVQYDQPLYNTPGSGVVLSMVGTPAPVTAYNTGTASWGIIWTNNLAPSSIQGTSLPNPNFIVGNVSIGGGSGIIRLSNLSITAGASTSLLDSSVTAY